MLQLFARVLRAVKRAHKSVSHRRCISADIINLQEKLSTFIFLPTAFSLMASKARRFYSKSSSCAGRLIRTVTQERSTTPSRQRNACYGPGVALEEVENTLNNNTSAEYSDYEDFEFEEGRHSQDRLHQADKGMSVSTPNNSEIISFLQQQQQALQKVIDGQRAIEERQTSLEEKLTYLENKLSTPQPSPTSSAASSSEGKRKRVVTRTLSVSLVDLSNY